jgi:hypothetical protein
VRSCATRLALLTGILAVLVRRKGRVALRLLVVATRRESVRATTQDTGDEGEGNEGDDRLHRRRWYGLPVLAHMLSSLYNLPGKLW